MKYQLQVGDNVIEIEGATRDEAIKRIGLNPIHWKEEGEDMTEETNSKTQTQEGTLGVPADSNIKKSRKPRADKGKPHKKGTPVVAKSRRKPNITLEDLARKQRYDFEGETYELWQFEPNPRVKMHKIGSEVEKEGNLTDFAGFRRLIPEPERKRKEGK